MGAVGIAVGVVVGLGHGRHAATKIVGDTAQCAEWQSEIWKRVNGAWPVRPMISVMSPLSQETAKDIGFAMMGVAGMSAGTRLAN